MVIGCGVLVENTPRKLPKGLLRGSLGCARMRTPKGTTKGSSGHVATVLLRKKRACAEHPVAPPQMRLELSPYTTLVGQTTSGDAIC